MFSFDISSMIGPTFSTRSRSWQTCITRYLGTLYMYYTLTRYIVHVWSRINLVWMLYICISKARYLMFIYIYSQGCWKLKITASRNSKRQQTLSLYAPYLCDCPLQHKWKIISSKDINVTYDYCANLILNKNQRINKISYPLIQLEMSL